MHMETTSDKLWKLWEYLGKTLAVMHYEVQVRNDQEGEKIRNVLPLIEQLHLDVANKVLPY